MRHPKHVRCHLHLKIALAAAFIEYFLKKKEILFAYFFKLHTSYIIYVLCFILPLLPNLKQQILKCFSKHQHQMHFKNTRTSFSTRIVRHIQSTMNTVKYNFFGWFIMFLMGDWRRQAFWSTFVIMMGKVTPTMIQSLCEFSK